MNHPHINPGIFEIYCGPVKSGKTREILNRVDKIKYIEDCNFLFIKPKIDTRNDTVISRFGNISFECIFVDENYPKEILNIINEKVDILLIDEIQFFSKEIVNTIETLLKENIHVIASGLDTDFRGEPFGKMPELMTIATHIHKLTGICDYKGCSKPSLRSQRLVHGKPAHISE
ncbi:MAG: thymidine kinase, partial [Nanoarchaeota archaeon]|nr:thymidine kinase [Nanoarchaeota archaeon]